MGGESENKQAAEDAGADADGAEGEAEVEAEGEAEDGDEGVAGAGDEGEDESKDEDEDENADFFPSEGQLGILSLLRKHLPSLTTSLTLSLPRSRPHS